MAWEEERKIQDVRNCGKQEMGTLQQVTTIKIITQKLSNSTNPISNINSNHMTSRQSYK